MTDLESLLTGDLVEEIGFFQREVMFSTKTMDEKKVTEAIYTIYKQLKEKDEYVEEHPKIVIVDSPAQAVKTLEASIEDFLSRFEIPTHFFMYQFFKDQELVPIPQLEVMEAYVELAKNSIGYFPYDDIVIISKNPLGLVDDNKRSYMLYADGEKHEFIKNVKEK